MVDKNIKINDMKCYRIKQCLSNIDFILSNTSLTEWIIDLSNQLSNKNSYHNFWHQVAVAKVGILIWKEENCTMEELNLIALLWLFHDAWHTGKSLPEDEENAFQLTIKNITQDQLYDLWVTKEKLHSWIIATNFSERWKHKWKIEQIIQDADMQSIGFWINYMLYADTQYIDEIWLWAKEFKECQRKFVNELYNIHKVIFLSDWAKTIYKSPLLEMDKLNNLENSIIEKAFKLKKEDITFEEFCDVLNLLR